jgi:beta-N-acetylhexosaminidase
MNHGILSPIPAGFGIALAVALAGLGLLIPDPIVFPWRATVTATLTTVAGIAGTTVLAAGRRWTAALLALSAMVAIWQGTRPWAARAEVLARAGADDIDVARHFVVGYSDPAVARELVRDGHVGGIFLTRRNVAGRTIAAIAAEIAGLQAIRRAAGLPPLIVAADQEGGPVSHLSPPLPTPPALSSFAALPPSDRRQAARRLGLEQGTALRTIGVTIDLAPVADLAPAGPPGLLDRNTRIATRSISGDPATVADVAAGFSEGLLASGVMPTAKHFPGLGRVAADTHLFSASLDVSAQDLAAADWIPFRAVLNIPGTAIMLSHVALSHVDGGVPASRSKKIVVGILRDGWHFDGIAITDDLSMGAVEHAGLCRAVEGALNAGIDLLLVSWDTDKVYPALRCALDALDAGRLDRAILRESARRLDRPAVVAADE